MHEWAASLETLSVLCYPPPRHFSPSPFPSRIPGLDLPRELGALSFRRGPQLGGLFWFPSTWVTPAIDKALAPHLFMKMICPLQCRQGKLIKTWLLQERPRLPPRRCGWADFQLADSMAATGQGAVEKEAGGKASGTISALFSDGCPGINKRPKTLKLWAAKIIPMGKSLVRSLHKYLFCISSAPGSVPGVAR